MKKSLVFIIWFVSYIALNGQTEKKITILHTNDLHSRLMGYAPESEYSPLTLKDDKTVGGFARIAAIIKSEKESSTGTTLVFDAGDFFSLSGAGHILAQLADTQICRHHPDLNSRGHCGGGIDGFISSHLSRHYEGQPDRNLLAGCIF